MKKSITFGFTIYHPILTTAIFTLLFSFISNTFSQPQYYNYNTSAADNSFPFNIAGGKMIQTLIIPGGFNQPVPSPNGNITSIFFAISATYPLGPVTYTNFRILVLDTTLSGLPPSLVNGNWDTVYFRATTPTINAAVNTWLQFTLDHSHAYNNAKSLIIQIEHCGASGTFSGFSFKHASSSPNKRNYSASGCPFSYGGTSPYVADCGINLDTLVGIGNYSSEIPDNYKLEQNYPNPFNPITSINFSLPHGGNTILALYDILGREVTVLVNEMKKAGRYSVTFDGTNFASGSYFFILKSGGFFESKKMLLIK
jgi:hypothetical protein